MAGEKLPEDPRSDAALLEAINRGDEVAFTALYRRHGDWVVRVAARYTGDRDLALDAMQETFAYLLRKAPALRLDGRMTTFLYPIVRHTAQALRRKYGGSTPPLLDEHAVAAGPPPLDSNDLAILLADLPTDGREVVMMRFVDDLSLAEVARVLSVPLGTVKSRLHHAIRRLRASPAAREFFEVD